MCQGRFHTYYGQISAGHSSMYFKLLGVWCMWYEHDMKFWLAHATDNDFF